MWTRAWRTQDKGLVYKGFSLAMSRGLTCTVKGFTMLYCEGLHHAVAMHRALQGDVELLLGCAGRCVQSVAVKMV
jgi:hypothetical protein